GDVDPYRVRLAVARSLQTWPRCLQLLLFFFQAEDGIRDFHVTGVQTCALPISRMPCSIALRAALSAVTWAAYGVLLREPRKPEPPALAQEIALPCGSVSVTIVLLNVDLIYARPRGMFLRSRRRTRVRPRPRRRSAM